MKPVPLLLACLASAASISLAQTQPTPPPSTLPSTLPSTQPAVVTAPPGFVRFESGGRSFVTAPADREWVQQAIAAIKPPAPTTRPADLADRLTARRAVLRTAITTDFPALPPADVDTFLEGQLGPLAEQWVRVGTKPVYLVSTALPLKGAMRAGWTDARLHYNRLIDKIDEVRPIAWGLPGMTDESVVLIVYATDQTPAARQDDLVRAITDGEARSNTEIVRVIVRALIGRTSTFLADKALTGVPLGDDQIWFADGLSAVLAAKYVAMVHGAPMSALIRSIITAPVDPRVNPAAIDLLHPLPADALRPELVRPYAAARHEKNTAVMYLWLVNGGDKKIDVTLGEIKKLKPADGETLAKLVGSASGVEVLTALRPR